MTTADALRVEARELERAAARVLHEAELLFGRAAAMKSSARHMRDRADALDDAEDLALLVGVPVRVPLRDLYLRETTSNGSA